MQAEWHGKLSEVPIEEIGARISILHGTVQFLRQQSAKEKGNVGLQKAAAMAEWELALCGDSEGEGFSGWMSFVKSGGSPELLSIIAAALGRLK